MAFSGSTHGRIAGHQRNRLARQRAEPDRAAQPRRRPCRLDSGMPGADDNDIEFHYVFSHLFNTVQECIERLTSDYSILGANSAYFPMQNVRKM